MCWIVVYVLVVLGSVCWFSFVIGCGVIGFVFGGGRLLLCVDCGGRCGLCFFLISGFGVR